MNSCAVARVGAAVTHPLTSGWMVIGNMKFSSSLEAHHRVTAREATRSAKTTDLYRYVKVSFHSCSTSRVLTCQICRHQSRPELDIPRISGAPIHES